METFDNIYCVRGILGAVVDMRVKKLAATLSVVFITTLPATANQDDFKPLRLPVPEDDTYVSVLKKYPKRQQPTVFYPHSFLCATSFGMLIRDVEDQTSEPLALSYHDGAMALISDPVRSWRVELTNVLNDKFSQLQERSDVKDKLLVVETSFDINQNGQIGNLTVSRWCPADFHSMIITTLKSIEGNSILALPDRSLDNTVSVTISGRFVQNYGPKFLKRKKEKPST